MIREAPHTTTPLISRVRRVPAQLSTCNEGFCERVHWKTRRTLWGLQNLRSHCLNVLKWSDGRRDSNPLFYRTHGFSEDKNPCNNWFLSQDRVQQGNIEENLEGKKGCYERWSIFKVGFDGKCRLLTASMRDDPG